MFINLLKFSCSRAWNHWQWKHIMRDGFIFMLFLMRTKNGVLLPAVKEIPKYTVFFLWLIDEASPWPLQTFYPTSRKLLLNCSVFYTFIKYASFSYVHWPCTWNEFNEDWWFWNEFTTLVFFSLQQTFFFISQNSFLDKICITMWLHVISHRSKKFPCFCVCWYRVILCIVQCKNTYDIISYDYVQNVEDR